MSEKQHRIDLNKIFNRLVIVISVGILAHLIFLLITTDRDIMSNLSKLRLPYILLIFGLIMVPWIGHSIRMVLWTKFLDVPLKFRECFRIAVTTDLGSSITPTLIGGGPIKLGMLMKKGISAGKAGTLTLLGGFEDFIMYVGSFLLACYFLKDTIILAFQNLYVLLKDNLLWFVLLVVIMYLIFRVFRGRIVNMLRRYLPMGFKNMIARLGRGIRKSWNEMKEAFTLILRKGKTYFLISFTILITQWVAKFTILIVILTALGLPFEILQTYLQQWLVYLSMIFIPTPGATGGAEASFYFIFNGEIDTKFLPLIVSVWRFFTYYMILFSAVVLVQLFSVYDLRFRKTGA